ncbi:aspartate kinase [Daejeonella sp.]|uniref:aspartate kinase n=1 Tax=Daejeonella sp. TaxID=2805397 RepID=UPI0027B8D9D9|nr:aspartate kinase [Daejeonella sp.]
MIKVFKFGGFAVSDAESVKNLLKIIGTTSSDQILIIVSAMGKTTDALEKLCKYYVEGNEDVQDILKAIKQFHENIMIELFQTKVHPVFDEIANTFVEIEWMLEDEPHPDYDFNYDQIVSIGEFLSSRIVAAYLNVNKIDTKWVDARDFIHTDNTYREGIIDMDKTSSSMPFLKNMLEKQTVITQGFIGGTSENFSTTLGREGSDYSAAIFASCLNAESLTVWKDVPGIMNADPRLFKDAKKYEELPYSEALEMAYYGATVIHPKTIKPLQNAGVPLFVRPFLFPEQMGTRIDSTAKLNTDLSAIIVKQNQMLLSISLKDFSFIDEHILIFLLQIISEAHIKLNMMQRSALSLSVCFNQDGAKFNKLYDILKDKFKCKYNEGLDLLTVRHFKRDKLETILAGRTVMMEQFSRNTAQIILQ